MLLPVDFGGYGMMRTPVGAAGGPVGVVPRGMTKSVTLCAGSVAVTIRVGGIRL